MELAADESVILAYWQLRDGVADHDLAPWPEVSGRGVSFWSTAYRKAAALRPDFDDARVRGQLGNLSGAGAEQR